MKDEEPNSDQQNAKSDIYESAVKKQTRKERSKANQGNGTAKKRKKQSLWRNWKSFSRTRQLELIFLGLVAIGGVGYLFMYVRFFHIEHRPLVIHSRPPELLMPFICDKTRNALTTGNMRSFVKNTGSLTAYDVNAFIDIPKLVPDRRRTEAGINEPPVGDCLAKINKTAMDFPLAPGVEKSPQMRQSVMSLPPLDDGDAVQLYIAECAYYSDESGNRYGTCDTYRLMLPSANPLDEIGGNPSFVCDGKPRTGRFIEAIGGHCQI